MWATKTLRIREIRASERWFYQKITDIYARRSPANTRTRSPVASAARSTAVAASWASIRGSIASPPDATSWRRSAMMPRVHRSLVSLMLVAACTTPKTGTTPEAAPTPVESTPTGPTNSGPTSSEPTRLAREEIAPGFAAVVYHHSLGAFPAADRHARGRREETVGRARISRQARSGGRQTAVAGPLDRPFALVRARAASAVEAGGPAH
ncbi:MAG: virulence RhuM family protein [Nannocystis sp.]|nr:virulence RhuM family protein [Nannocystis sp.]